MPRSTTPFLIVLLAGLAPALAQPGVEIQPFAALRLGGDFVTTSDDHFFDDLGVKVDDGAAYGVTLDFSVTRNLQVELLASRQDTTLFDDEGFLGRGPRLFDLDVDYYHAGVLYQWLPGQVRPFLAVSLGVTRFDPHEAGLDSENRLSGSVGGGVKLFFSRRFGVRFEGRFFGTVIDQDEQLVCRRFRCDRFVFQDSFTQGELRGGLIFAF